jgi:hypothetical protein
MPCERFGFAYCALFASCGDDPNSVFLTCSIEDQAP